MIMQCCNVRSKDGDAEGEIQALSTRNNTENIRIDLTLDDRTQTKRKLSII